MQFNIRDAVPEDSDQLIELTAITPMKGKIGLKIERKPDFFSLLNLSESFIMLVAENNNSKITGCFAATRDTMYVTGKPVTVYYLRDLKVHPEYTGSMLAYYLVKKMYSRLLEAGADILYCTMASGNNAVTPFFKGRVGIPPFVEISNYNIYQVLPSHKASPARRSNITSAKLAGFFNACFQKFTIAPYEIQPDQLNDCVLFSSGNETDTETAIAAFDPFRYRQNIVTHYSLSITLLLAALRFLKLFFKMPLLPAKLVPLRMLYVRFYAFNNGKENAFKNLVKHLRHYAFEKKYHLIAIAADEKDANMNRLLKPMSHFVFRSSRLATSLKHNEDLLQQMKQGISYEDYSLI